MTGPPPAAHGSTELDVAGLAAWGERLGAALPARGFSVIVFVTIAPRLRKFTNDSNSLA